MNNHIIGGGTGFYSKRYAGISFVPSPGMGTIISFPLSISIENGVHISSIMADNISSWTILEASSDLGYFVLRYYLSDAHDVYADAEYAVVGKGSFVCRIIFCNNTSRSIVAKTETAFLHEWERPSVSPKFPKGACIIQAEEYRKIGSYCKLALDGERVCVRQMLFAVNQRALEGGIGKWPGDFVEYPLSIKNAIEECSVYVRYCKTGEISQGWDIEIDGIKKRHYFAKTADRYGSFSGWKFVEVKIGSVGAGEHTLRLSVADPENSEFLENKYQRNIYGNLEGVDAPKDMSIAFDCIVVARQALESSSWILRSADIPLQIEYSLCDGRLLLKDRRLRKDGCFVVGGETDWERIESVVTEYALTENLYHHKHDLQPKSDADTESDIVREPSVWLTHRSLPVAAGKRTESLFAVANGSSVDVADKLWVKLKEDGFGALINSARASYERLRFRVYDSEYGVSVRHIAAYLMSSVNYPCTIKNRIIAAESPAKCAFPVPYTWDAGLTALGQIEIDEKRAVANLRQYLDCNTEEEGYIQHGTALPTQIYAAWALFQKNGNVDFLKEFYGLLKNAALFYAGYHKASTSLRNGNGFINTSDIWYNSVGMDDYPVQVEFVKKNIVSHGEFPETNSSGIRFAKILRNMAVRVGFLEDIPLYESIIEKLTKPLLALWDKSTGYFHYALSGKPYLFENKVNWNMGIAGAYPLVAGLEGEDVIVRALLENIKTDGFLLCKYGLSTVDLRAPYYKDDGYWNGRVWMAHHWMFWKSLLDLGEVDFASELAHRALKTYAKAEKKQGHCHENFMVSTGIGAGTPHFGALSAPIVAFYSAYFTPGRISTGFDSFVTDRKNDEEGYPVSFGLCDYFRKKYSAGVVIVLKPLTSYEINGRKFKTGASGALSFLVALDKRTHLNIKSLSD